MHLHLEGPTGPHGEMKLPNAGDSEMETDAQDSSVGETDSTAPTDAPEPAYIN